MPSRRLSVEDIVALARRAEKRGYDSVWIPETWGVDAVSVLAVLARETERIRIAAGVFNIFSRSPALVAQTAATLENLSRNRFILGLGTSGPIVVENFHGLPYRRPIERTDDYVNIIRLALSGERIDYAGREFTLKGFRLGNPPADVPPIFIAALGPRNIRLTGGLADGWLPIFALRGQIGTPLAQLRTAQREVGRATDEVIVAAYIPAVTAPRGESLIAQQVAYYVGGMGTYYANFLTRAGFGTDVTRVRSLWRDGNVAGAAHAVPGELLSRVSISGPNPRAALDEFRSEGIQIPILAPPRGATREEIEGTIDELAPESPS